MTIKSCPFYKLQNVIVKNPMLISIFENVLQNQYKQLFVSETLVAQISQFVIDPMFIIIVE